MNSERFHRRRRGQRPITENHERWLLTYADMITLLLALFVVMYSMSRIDSSRFHEMSSALSGILKGGKNIIMSEAAISTDRLIKLREQFMTSLKPQIVDSTLTAEVTARGLVIQIREGALFEEAQAELTPGARSVLHAVGENLVTTTNQIRVEGHTDSRPIKTERFPTNWELSTARATSVLRYFVDSLGLEPSRVSAVGFGEFRPMRPNDSPEHMAANRRVDIVILSDQWSKAEPKSAEHASHVPQARRPELIDDVPSTATPSPELTDNPTGNLNSSNTENPSRIDSTAGAQPIASDL